METIQIMALRHSAFYSPLLMTMAGGFLRAVGLQAVYTVATPENTVADNLLQGRCHVAQSAVATSFAALEQGLRPEIVHFAQINARDGFFLAAKQRDDAFCWSKLEGKRVLVDHFFQPLAMFRYGLYKQGVDWHSFTSLDAGGVEEILAAFRDNQADYVHLQGPAPQQLQHDGMGYVVAALGDAVGPVAFSSLCATRTWLQTETEMAQAFMTAYQNALQMIATAPAQEIAMQLRAGGFFRDINVQVLSDTVAAYQQLQCWSADAHIPLSHYQNLLDVFEFSGQISQRYPYDEVIFDLSRS